MERITKVRLPFDRRHEDPKKNYGIHGLDVWFILKGPKGAIQFLVNFGIYLPHLYSEYAVNFPNSLKPKIDGYDVGYHAMAPQFEGHSPMDNCDLFEGPCYYDGSSLRAKDWVEEIFSIKGSHPEDEIWRRLETEYDLRFGKPEESKP